MADRDALLARLEQLDELETRRAERSLHAFMKLLWPAMEPAKPFVDNWHIQAVAEHLEAVAAGQIPKLLINQPPATTKSLTVSVAFPSWIWARDPGKRFMCLSYDQRLATRDARRMRMLVMSDLYQQRWPVALADDQNLKRKYDTTAGGWRISLGLTAGIVGEHPHGKIVDDPHNTRSKVLTDVELATAADVWDFGLATRGATLNAWTVLLMQRLHERDLSGHWLAQDPSVVHLCLPMKYEPPVWVDLGAGKRELRARMKPTPLGWTDPRTQPGELLWPAEWPQQKIDDLVRASLGPWGEAGQLQQRPSAPGGLMFKADWFKQIAVAPAGMVDRVRYWDVAATEGGSGPRTAGVLMGRTADGKFVIEDIVKGRWAPPAVDTTIHATAQSDGRSVRIREEAEGGSAGPAVVIARTQRLAGFDYKGADIKGKSKQERAHPLAVQAAAGNVSIVVGFEGDTARQQLVREFLDEIVLFPLGALKDQCVPAGTRIATVTGDRPIESVRVGDYVLTRSGYRRVEWAGMTSVSARLWEIETANGRLLLTEEHPVFIAGYGFKATRDVSIGDIMWTWASPLSSSESRSSSSADEPIRATQMRLRAISACTSLAAHARCIVTSGLRLMGQFLAATWSITKTSIRWTIRQPIWIASPMLSTSGSALRLATFPSLRPWRTWRLSGQRRPPGIALRLGVPGTASTAREPGQPENPSKRNASSAASRTSRRITTSGRGFVVRVVRSAIGIAARGIRTRPSANIVASSSWPREVAGGFVPTAVRRVHATPHVEPVYNLRVAGAHEYVANGLLVHNCDACAGALNELTRANVGEQELLFAGPSLAAVTGEIGDLERRLGLRPS